MTCRVAFCAALLLMAGCHHLPVVVRQPSVYNPFPQLARVAVAPFFNLSTEPTVDGRHFAEAYYHELQSVPGFEVLPVGVVEMAMREHGLSLAGPAEAQRLAQLLEVDAIVVGAVNDFSPYYPPRCALQVEWYAANPQFHPIPPGYGLPWGTPEEIDIPEPLLFETAMAMARARLQAPQPLSAVELVPPGGALDESDAAAGARQTAAIAATAPGGATDTNDSLLPAGPPPLLAAPAPQRIELCEPVLRHTKVYNGSDPDVTAALATYVGFRDDERFGGWRSYLQRSDDFIRFCCHLHVSETLAARGGAGPTRVVWHWPSDR